MLRGIASRVYRARIRYVPLTRFERAFRTVESHAMTGPLRLSNLYRRVQRIIEDRIPGHIVECGCGRGGSAALLAIALRDAQCPPADRKVWLYDTFEGLPEPTMADPDYEEAKQWTGTCRGELDSISELMTSLGLADRAIYVKGLYQDTLPNAMCFPIALLHIDCDWYESTKTCLNELYAEVSPGGIIQIDDYLTWRGCRKAVDEFLALHTGVRIRSAGSPAIWFRKPMTI